MVQRIVWVLSLIVLLASHGLANPIAVSLPTNDLDVALSNFSSVAFNGFVRWESASASTQYKTRIGEGASGNPGISNGGGGITWRTDAPQSFSFSFNGNTAILTILDGSDVYSVSADPANTAMNSLLIGIRSRPNTTISISDLKIDGVSLNIGSLSLGSGDDRSFLFVSNVFAPFTLTGLIEMTNVRGNTGQEIPALQIFAGMSPQADEANVPEPGTSLLVGVVLLLLALSFRQRMQNARNNPDR